MHASALRGGRRMFAMPSVRVARRARHAARVPVRALGVAYAVPRVCEKALAPVQRRAMYGSKA